MQTSRFQLGLIATLAVGLGFSLSSSEAVGYPAASVSMGENPLWSYGGAISGGGWVDLELVDGDKSMVVTDLLLTASCMNCDVNAQVYSGAKQIGEARIYAYAHGGDYNVQPRSIGHSFSSGMVVQPGDTLRVHAATGTGFSYTFSGYYAQP